MMLRNSVFTKAGVKNITSFMQKDMRLAMGMTEEAAKKDPENGCG
jgi:hypothetical protein